MFDAVVEFLIRFGVYGVITAAFFEAIFLPPPVELILIPVMMSNKPMAVYYGLLTVAASTAGSIAGYWLGRATGKKLLDKLFKKDRVSKVSMLYEKYGIIAILTSAFTPIPYEVYVLSAGAFRMGFLRFLLSSIVSRALRYITEGIAIYKFGYIIEIDSISNILLLCLLVAAALLLFKVLKKRAE